MERPISPMRAKRFVIKEGEGSGKLSNDDKAAIPNAAWYPKMDVYGHYRAMVLAASLPDHPTIPPYGPMADHPFSAGYSVADQQIIDMASKLCGFPPTKLSDKDSKESEHVHKVSPVNGRAHK
jgi:hypothetical protein